MSATAILVVGVGVVLALPIAWRVARSRFDPFEPIVIFGLAWGAMFVVRPAAMLIRDDMIFRGVDISPTLDKAVLLALLGAVAFVVGYELSLGSRFAALVPRPHVDDISTRALSGALVVGTLGILALALFLLTAGGWSALETFLAGRSQELDELLRKSTHYLWWSSLAVVPAALVGFAAAYNRRTRASLAGAVALLVFALVRTVPTGSRIYLLVLVGGIVVFVYLHRRTRPSIVTAAIAVGLALFLSSSVLAFRYAYGHRDLLSVARSLAASPSRLVVPITEGADAEMAPALAGGLLVIPSELSYRYGGATIGDLLLRPIPRQLWSGKPQPAVLVVTEEVWPGPRKLGNFQPASTPMLSFYWDFGLLGVVVGMALYGLLARGMYEYLLRSIANAPVQLVYAAAIWTLVVALRFDPTLFVAHSVVVFVPMVALLALPSRPRRRAERAVDERRLSRA